VKLCFRAGLVLSLPDGRVCLAQHHAVLAGASQIEHLVGQSLNEVDPAPFFIFGWWKVGLRGEFESGGMVRDSDLDRALADQQVQTHRLVSSRRGGVLHRVVRGLGESEFPPAQVPGFQALLGEKLPPLPATFPHGVQITGHFQDEGAVGEGANGRHKLAIRHGSGR